MNICPLCSSENNSAISEILSKDLIKLYKLNYSLDIGYLLDTNFIISIIECNRCKLQYFIPLTPGDEQFYDNLQKTGSYFGKDRPEFHHASKYISKEDSVLEIGAGNGAFRKFIAAEKYLGLDFSPEAAKQAAKEGILIENVSYNEHLERLNNKYSVIVAFQVLEHIPNLTDFLSICIKSIDINGYIIFSVPNNYSYIQYQMNDALNLPPHHCLKWNEPALKYIAELYNLELIDLIPDKTFKKHQNRLYYNTILIKRIRNFFGLKKTLIDLSIFYKILFFLVNSLSLVFNKIDKNFGVGKDAHTITAVFRKK